MASDCSRFERKESAERSAPAAKINGLPMIAIAAGVRPIASVIALFNASSDCGPKVFGRVWSKPLSSVIKARDPLCPNGVRSTSRSSALVISYCGAPSGN